MGFDLVAQRRTLACGGSPQLSNVSVRRGAKKRDLL
jgi:hypothetical protein